jgi:hypothetical protein
MPINIDRYDRLPPQAETFSPYSIRKPSARVSLEMSSLHSLQQATQSSSWDMEKVKTILQKYVRIAREFIDNLRANFYILLDPPLDLENFSSAVVEQKKSKEEIIKLFFALSPLEQQLTKKSICERKNQHASDGSFAETCIKNDPFDKDVLFATIDAIAELKKALAPLQKFKETVFNYSSTSQEAVQAFKNLPYEAAQLLRETLKDNESVKLLESDPKNVKVKRAIVSWIQRLSNS